MKTTTRLKCCAALALLLLALLGCKEDVTMETMEYHPEDDVYIMVEGQIIEDTTSVLPAELVGEMAFELQEGTHESITDASGAEVDHYYIWVCLEDACIPVDPFRVSS